MGQLKQILHSLASRSSAFLRYLQALLSPKTFRREILSVYAGIRAHDDTTESLEGRIYRLRRNIHRIEKGLIMQPRRDVFAVNYIEETIDAYEMVVESSNHNAEELKWFHDVLWEYFAATGDHEVISTCRARFENIQERDPREVSYIPAERTTYPAPRISYEDFFYLCRRRRSVRWYQDKPVSRDLVDKAILAAMQSPSACNRQAFEFRIFDTPELVKKVAGIPMGTRGFSHQFPMIVVLVGKLNAYEFERDRHLIYIDSSLAAMSFMLALETLGLSSCPINWPDIEKNEIQMSKVLLLECYERPVMLISVGFAKDEGLIPFSCKAELSKIRHFN